jgi:hypothetical protein
MRPPRRADQVAVEVAITTSMRHVLVVQVDALLAQPGGRFPHLAESSAGQG